MNDTSKVEPVDMQALVQQIKQEAKERDEQLAGDEFQAVDTEDSFLVTLAPAVEQESSEQNTVLPDFQHRNDFLVYEGKEFIRYAYLGILLREPDQSGMSNYLKFLQSGGSREAVLAKLMLSDEGLDKAVPIEGMSQLLARTKKLKKKWWRNKKISYTAYDQDLFFQPIQTPILRIQKDIEQQAKLQQQVTDDQFAEIRNQLSSQQEEQKNQFKLIQVDSEKEIGLLERQLQVTEDQFAEIRNQLSSQQEEQQNQFKLIQADSEKEIGLLERQLQVTEDQFAEIRNQLSSQQEEQKSQFKLIQADNEKVIEQLEQQVQVTQDQLAEVRRQFSYQQRNQDLFLQQLIKNNHQKLSALAETENTHENEQENQQLKKWQQLLEQHSIDKLDAYYIAFEDACRGTREEIRNNLKEYLPLLEQTITELATQKSNNEKQLDVLDLGCGRGEWLQLLNENNWQTAGIDTNTMMVQDCLKMGLNVQDEDVNTYLKHQASDTISVITAFHLIEHIPFIDLFSLFEESIRILKPGGMILFETPNPENILVGSHTFYHDPTHKNPLTPTSMEFLASYTGFTKIQIMRLHPYPDAAKVPGVDPLTERINGHLCGPQDYAIIAKKPQQTRQRPSADTNPA